MTNITTISRPEARAAGLKRYFTGNSCGRGHVSERFTATGNCIECANSGRRVTKFNEIARMAGEIVDRSYLGITIEQAAVLDQFVATFREQNAKSAEDRIKYAEFYSREQQHGRDAALRACVNMAPCPPIPLAVLRAVSDENGGKLPDWVICTGNFIDWNW